MREVVVLIDTVDWENLATLFERAPMDVRSPAWLRAQFVSSPVRCFAHLGSTLVGAGCAARRDALRDAQWPVAATGRDSEVS